MIDTSKRCIGSITPRWAIAVTTVDTDTAKTSDTEEVYRAFGSGHSAVLNLKTDRPTCPWLRFESYTIRLKRRRTRPLRRRPPRVAQTSA
ncbi:hypothetical protein EVAR_96747_1 [Eumeta japonica]|uniref:Uncharacterized protein n=1 Tax=Eumeta variegata TaxID=151549 RepID=A0A4C1Y1G9_EUMVA|nr:hypothetical protein EVAR_96747_1 [Eumeta japonica]